MEGNKKMKSEQLKDTIPKMYQFPLIAGAINRDLEQNINFVTMKEYI